jgi:hypothetical protein
MITPSRQAVQYFPTDTSAESDDLLRSVLDFNSNGRFDDVVTVPAGARSATDPVYLAFGDMLLIVPVITAAPAPPISRLDPEGRQCLSELLRIDGRFYEVQISAAGDQLTLTPSSVAIGWVTNPNVPWSGTIYGDHGFLPIRVEQGKPAAVPEGRWKLLSYSMTVIDSTCRQRLRGERRWRRVVGFRRCAGSLGSGVAPWSW